MTQHRIPSLLLIASSLFAVNATVAQVQRTHVAQGDLVGKREGRVTAFLGVPFAAPPVGANRWRPPQAPAVWQGERPADHFSASCQQGVTPNGFGPWTSEYVVHGVVSEDCLYLNIWSPARAPRQRLPVLYWIYGGGFSSGSGSVPIYDGAALAAKDIVVVTVNYRVGVYGFLAHPALSAESPEHASGNYGLLDQVAGLRWVHENIGSFGGDATKVTIAGQSAGAASVHYLIASPLAKGLFARAIAESGSGMGLRVPDHASAEATGLELGRVGGTALSLAQLRALSPAELDARVARMPSSGAASPLRFGPVVDGWFFPSDGIVGMNTNDTPILTGMTASEMTGLSPTYGHSTAATFNAQLEATYHKDLTQFAALYGPQSDADAWEATNALARDRGLASMYFWARGRLPSTRYPIYAYLWTHPEPGPNDQRYGAFHSSEIPYVFETLDSSKRPFTPVDRALSRQISQYWINFVKTGDPNGQGLPNWPRLSEDGTRILEIGDRTASRPILAPKELALFERYVADGGSVSLF